jgi:hypothetical protein
MKRPAFLTLDPGPWTLDFSGQTASPFPALRLAHPKDNQGAEDLGLKVRKARLAVSRCSSGTLKERMPWTARACSRKTRNRKRPVFPARMVVAARGAPGFRVRAISRKPARGRPTDAARRRTGRRQSWPSGKGRASARARAKWTAGNPFPGGQGLPLAQHAPGHVHPVKFPVRLPPGGDPGCRGRRPRPISGRKPPPSWR